jgi:hypothetical protein
MRDRTISTALIWIASAIGISALADSFTQTVTSYIPQDIERGTMDIVRETFFMPEPQVYVVGVLILLVIVGAAISTAVVWRNAASNAEIESARARRQYEKSKNEENVRYQGGQARLMRLMESLSDEEIAYLESRSLSDDGELYAPRR